MPKTTFHPETHGFAFINSWDFEDAERQTLRDTFDRYLKWGTLASTAVLGLPGAILAPLGITTLRNKLEAGLAPGYGLCGGMAFAALDYFLADRPLPRGDHAWDHPTADTRLRRYLWQRQIRSLVSDLDRFLAWLVLLEYVPKAWPFRGGEARLEALTRKEWAKLKRRIDQGTPVPLGLVRDTEYVFDNHQVLALGYSEPDQTRGTISLYDPNCPDVESQISFQWGADSEWITESCGGIAPLRGFFCEIYEPADPPAA
jgi:hypothetical protein